MIWFIIGAIFAVLALTCYSLCYVSGECSKKEDEVHELRLAWQAYRKAMRRYHYEEESEDNWFEYQSAEKRYDTLLAKLSTRYDRPWLLDRVLEPGE